MKCLCKCDLFSDLYLFIYFFFIMILLLLFFFCTAIYPIAWDYVMIYEKTFLFFFFLWSLLKRNCQFQSKTIRIYARTHVNISPISLPPLFPHCLPFKILVLRRLHSHWKTMKSCSVLMHGKCSPIMVMNLRPDVHCWKGNVKNPLTFSHFLRGK